VRVRRLLTHMAAAEPHRYVVVDADGPPDEVAERVAAGLAPLLPAPPTEAATVPTPLPSSAAELSPVGAAPTSLPRPLVGPTPVGAATTSLPRPSAGPTPVG